MQHGRQYIKSQNRQRASGLYCSIVKPYTTLYMHCMLALLLPRCAVAPLLLGYTLTKYIKHQCRDGTRVHHHSSVCDPTKNLRRTSS